MFLHNPEGLAHIAGNMVALLACGLLVEPALGSATFAFVYVASGILGAFLHVAVDPSSAVPLVGASGAVAGVLAVLGATRPRFVGFAVGFIAFNIWLTLSGTSGEVSSATHLGGAFCGVLFAAARAVSAGPRLVRSYQRPPRGVRRRFSTASTTTCGP